jgi:hypothetical protein
MSERCWARELISLGTVQIESSREGTDVLEALGRSSVRPVDQSSWRFWLNSPLLASFSSSYREIRPLSHPGMPNSASFTNPSSPLSKVSHPAAASLLSSTSSLKGFFRTGISICAKTALMGPGTRRRKGLERTSGLWVPLLSSCAV